MNQFGKRMGMIFGLVLAAVWPLWAGFTAVAQQNGLAAVATTTATACTAGMAGVYPCQNVHLLAHLPLSEMGVTTNTVKGNDHWGWTDPESGRDFVIFGLTDSTAFVEITDRQNPVYLGRLPAYVAGQTSVWWDVKVYENYAYITADIPSTNGLQVFDLTQLTAVTATLPVTFTEAVHYNGFTTGHNLWINEATGYLYAFRTTGDACNAGIHVINIQNPISPTFTTCFGDPPLSDAECVIYNGPDADYTGREICFVGSDDNVSIYDVTDKENITQTATLVYPGIHRAHQGSLTADQQYWLLSDTMDEMMTGNNTRTHVFDMTNLDEPSYVSYHEHATAAHDHNLYIVGNWVYEANFKAGLRVLRIGNLANAELNEMAYFDIAPDSDSVAMSGSWSNYPWWGDGVVTVSGTEEGLFVLQVDVPTAYLPLIGR